MIECEELGCCPLEFGLCACDLHAVADAFYPDGDPRRARFDDEPAAAARMGLVRSRLRGLADQIGHGSDEHAYVGAGSELPGARCGSCGSPIR